MSATIGFAGKGCGGFEIDRTRPAILQNYMSDTVWTKFCDDIDGKFGIISKATNWFLAGFCSVFVFAFIAFAFGGGYLFSLVGVGVVAMFASCFCLAKKQKQFETAMAEFIDETNRNYQGRVSFHFHNVSAGIGDSYQIDVSINASGASSAPKDTATRLQDLENMKHLLSNQEYEDKRRDILSDV